MFRSREAIEALYAETQRLVSSRKYANGWLWCANCFRGYRALDCPILEYKRNYYFGCPYEDCLASLEKSGISYRDMQAEYSHFPDTPIHGAYYTEEPKLTDPDNWRLCTTCFRCYTIDVHNAKMATELQPTCPYHEAYGCKGDLLHSEKWAKVIIKHTRFPQVPQHWGRYVTDSVRDISPGTWNLWDPISGNVYLPRKPYAGSL